jgi:hypothetical protein
MSGKLIVFEGTDGSGKATQSKLVCEELDRRGIAYRKLEFPRYSEESSALIRLYLSGAFGSKPEDIRAAIGPNVGMCHFETDGDVPEAMIAAFGDEVRQYIEKRGEKFFLDLKEINALSLRRAGLVHIDISNDCTMCTPDRFWSHRVTRGDRGSQGAVITCKEVCK